MQEHAETRVLNVQLNAPVPEKVRIYGFSLNHLLPHGLPGGSDVRY